MIDLPQGQVSAVVLGVMQDGGLPHIGCRCTRCAAAYADPSRTEYAACLAIVDRRGSRAAVWLIDATPDIKHQLNLLADVLGPHPRRPGRLRQPDGLFLTHAHMGHIAGMAQLGPEAMAVEGMPLYAAPGLIEMLRRTELWRPLCAALVLHPLPAGEPLKLAPDLTLTAVPVPHRDEWGVGTFAFYIQGPSRSLLYLPDIDAWEQWPEARERMAAVDVALVDASFYSSDELGGRAPVAHPLIPHTLQLYAGLPGRLVLTHLNHTNPVLDGDSPERAAVRTAGASVARTGQVFAL
ncbi:MAG: MBL fold metallo-hydrolase [Anaerolineae bacterium]